LQANNSLKIRPSTKWKEEKIKDIFLLFTVFWRTESQFSAEFKLLVGKTSERWSKICKKNAAQFSRFFDWLFLISAADPWRFHKGGPLWNLHQIKFRMKTSETEFARNWSHRPKWLVFFKGTRCHQGGPLWNFHQVKFLLKTSDTEFERNWSHRPKVTNY
jgi:hypothetical protein